ncbi:serine hydrolase domain-containing protein [Pedobacter sp. JY14-1]|uniref:serine hydrolase domain-containing protein n=1 Tax=Pedobacter sp. JY14-1 TaxID=3034151 RepID=UPI0023E22126|nr:serine hydrolase domain-containing protein [Pedobacter sp. JY14-1]
MKKPWHVFLLATTALALSLPVYAQQKPLTDNPLRSRLDSVVHRAACWYLKDSAANGIVLGVIEHGIPHYYRYGENVRGTGKLLPAGLYYNIGSVAKTFVATALAQAVIDKKAAMNDDIRKYLPGSYPNLQYQGIPIKLVDLANHTSALPGSFHQYSQASLNKLKDKSLKEQADFFSLYNQDSLLQDLSAIRPDTIPGTKFRYNSSAYMLLTLILERIYQQPYRQIIDSYLQKHLHLSHIKPILSGAELRQSAQGYNRKGEPVNYINLSGFYIGPSMNATLIDMVKYLQAQLSEKDAAIRLTHQQTFGRRDGFGMGLGWMLNSENGQRYIYHDGNTKIGFNTLITLYPEIQSGIVIIVNETSSQQRVGQLENKINSGLIK